MTTFTDQVKLTCTAPCLTNEQILKSFLVSAGGSGYTTAPSVTIAAPGGEGTQATATASITGPITGIPITNSGSGYSTAGISFSGTGGATATPIMSGGHIIAIIITDGGDYDSPPTVTIQGDGTGATAQATMSVQSITITNSGSGYTSDPEVTIENPTGPAHACNPATAYAKARPDETVDVVLGTFPKGDSYLTFDSSADADALLVTTSDGNPLLTINKGTMIEKDLMVGGFVDSWQGALLLNYGLKGKPTLSSPPCIELMSSEEEYPSGSTLPSNPETGQLFNHDGTNKMWDGTGAVKSWVTGNFTGKYDTLFLFKADGISPAHLDLGNLTAHGYVYTNDLSPVPDQEWIDVHSKLRINGDLQLVNGNVASSLNPVSSGFGLGTGDIPWDGIVAVNGYFDTIYIKESEGSYYPVAGLSSKWGVMIATEEGGTMNPTGQQFVDAGYILQVVANPDASYSFDHWVLDGETDYTNPITIPGQEGGTVHSLQCVFTYNPSPPPYWQTFTVNYLGCEESIETNDAALIDESYQRSETITIENS